MDGPRSALGHTTDIFLDDPSMFTVLYRVGGLVVVLTVVLATMLEFVF